MDVRGKKRVDDRRVLSGIVHALKCGGRWADCADVYGRLQLGKRRIGLVHHMGAKRVVMCGELRFGATGPRTRARLPRPLPPPKAL